MSDKTCHCGQPIRYGYTGNPTDHRGMCAHCDYLRCDTDPGACKPNMRLQERIARIINSNMDVCGAAFEEVDGGGICTKHQDGLLETAQAVIDELGLREEHEYHTLRFGGLDSTQETRHRYVTPWEET